MKFGYKVFYFYFYYWNQIDICSLLITVNKKYMYMVFVKYILLLQVPLWCQKSGKQAENLAVWVKNNYC